VLCCVVLSCCVVLTCGLCCADAQVSWTWVLEMLLEACRCACLCSACASIPQLSASCCKHVPHQLPALAEAALRPIVIILLAAKQHR
jgi:hypothetical protein